MPEDESHDFSTLWASTHPSGSENILEYKITCMID
jgi:hypothetical protein